MLDYLRIFTDVVEMPYWFYLSMVAVGTLAGGTLVPWLRRMRDARRSKR